MKIVTKNKEVIYINLKNIDSVCIQQQFRYVKQNETDIFYCVMVSNGMSNVTVYESRLEPEAKEVLLDIGSMMEELEPEKTYLDGFKDGTEYALRLIKVNV